MSYELSDAQKRFNSMIHFTSTGGSTCALCGGAFNELTKFVTATREYADSPMPHCVSPEKYHVNIEDDSFAPKFDPVTKPRGYNSHPSGVECITVIEHMNFCLGNAIKYIWRAGEKPGADPIEDLKKARWYLDREIDRLSKGKA